MADNRFTFRILSLSDQTNHSELLSKKLPLALQTRDVGLLQEIVEVFKNLNRESVFTNDEVNTMIAAIEKNNSNWELPFIAPVTDMIALLISNGVSLHANHLTDHIFIRLLMQKPQVAHQLLINLEQQKLPLKFAAMNVNALSTSARFELLKGCEYRNDDSLLECLKLLPPEFIKTLFRTVNYILPFIESDQVGVFDKLLSGIQPTKDNIGDILQKVFYYDSAKIFAQRINVHMTPQI